MAEQLLDVQSQAVRAEKLAGVGRLAAGVAHEIRNPLGAFGTYVEVLRRRGADATLMDGMRREVARMDRIVEGLLDYARPGAPSGNASLADDRARRRRLPRRPGRAEGTRGRARGQRQHATGARRPKSPRTGAREPAAECQRCLKARGPDLGGSRAENLRSSQRARAPVRGRQRGGQPPPSARRPWPPGGPGGRTSPREPSEGSSTSPTRAQACPRRSGSGFSTLFTRQRILGRVRGSDWPSWRGPCMTRGSGLGGPRPGGRGRLQGVPAQAEAVDAHSGR